MPKKNLRSVAEELGLGVIPIDHRKKGEVDTFISRNIDRFRPVGFDGRVVLCQLKHEKEFVCFIRRDEK